jgi:hypothetical protein
MMASHCRAATRNRADTEVPPEFMMWVKLVKLMIAFLTSRVLGVEKFSAAKAQIMREGYAHHYYAALARLCTPAIVGQREVIAQMRGCCVWQTRRHEDGRVRLPVRDLGDPRAAPDSHHPGPCRPIARAVDRTPITPLY